MEQPAIIPFGDSSETAVVFRVDYHALAIDFSDGRTRRGFGSRHASSTDGVEINDVCCGKCLSSLRHWVSPVAGLGPGGKLQLPPGSLFWYTVFMTKSIKVHQKKKGRGRPATGR